MRTPHSRQCVICEFTSDAGMRLSDVRHLLVVVLALLVANTAVLACKDLLPALVNLELDHLNLYIGIECVRIMMGE